MTTLTLEEGLKKHTDVFKEELGTVQRMEVQMDPAAQFFHPRPISLLLRPRVEKELERVVQDKVIKPVQFSEWVASIVL